MRDIDENDMAAEGPPPAEPRTDGLASSDPIDSNESLFEGTSAAEHSLSNRVADHLLHDAYVALTERIAAKLTKKLGYKVEAYEVHELAAKLLDSGQVEASPLADHTLAKFVSALQKIEEMLDSGREWELAKDLEVSADLDVKLAAEDVHAERGEPTRAQQREVHWAERTRAAELEPRENSDERRKRIASEVDQLLSELCLPSIEPQGQSVEESSESLHPDPDELLPSTKLRR